MRVGRYDTAWTYMLEKIMKQTNKVIIVVEHVISRLVEVSCMHIVTGTTYNCTPEYDM